MKAGSAAKLIVDALLQRFLPLARRRIETAQAQVCMSSLLLYIPVACFHGFGIFYSYLDIVLVVGFEFSPKFMFMKQAKQ